MSKYKLNYIDYETRETISEGFEDSESLHLRIKYLDENMIANSYWYNCYDRSIFQTKEKCSCGWDINKS